ncbi:hypothetical protein NMY22_g14400 [Coprinellus aureogranulatus]|nr:hypothetical protein NMY22_g14400 [Coprinellus aureogranulatus]
MANTSILVHHWKQPLLLRPPEPPFTGTTTKRPIWPIVLTKGWKITHFCPIQLARARSQPPQHLCNVQAPSLLAIVPHFNARPLGRNRPYHRPIRRSTAQVLSLLRGKHRSLRLEVKEYDKGLRAKD